MSSAIQTVGGNQIVRLGSPLILGIRLQGTLGHVSAANPNQVKARPYIRYLAQTLQHLQCDVTLLVSTNHQFDGHILSQFAALDFPIKFRILHDHSDIARGNSPKNRTVSAKNYTQYFRGVAESHGTTLDRVLFVDSEINYRFTPVQTLVMERFEPLSRRQARQDLRRRMAESRDRERRTSSPVATETERKEEDGAAASTAAATDASSSSREKTRYASSRKGQQQQHPEDRARLDRDRQRRLETHQTHVRAAIADADGHTARLRAEQRFASTLAEPSHSSADDTGNDDEAEAGGRGGSGWLGRHDGRKATVTARNPAAAAAAAAAAAKNGSSGNSDNSGEAGRAEAAGGADGGHFTADDFSNSPSSLAVNLEDFSLVALADMITQLASSDAAVRGFIAMEPLVEKLRVPFHGVTNYLPIENCDFIEVLDWERIKVEEKAARDSGVPDIEEKEDEHGDFFK